MIDTQLDADLDRLEKSLGQLPEPAVRPVLIAVSGLPGTGKSYFTTRLAERLPLAVMESDILRRVLFPRPTYSLEESARLFRAVHSLIEKLLKSSIPVVLDATNLSERHREYLYNIADRVGVKLVLVRVEAPPELVQARLRRRMEEPEAKSGADWSVYEKMRPTVERIRRRHHVVDTSRDISPVLDKIVKEVRR